jgi:hypothetical protein
MCVSHGLADSKIVSPQGGILLARECDEMGSKVLENVSVRKSPSTPSTEDGEDSKERMPPFGLGEPAFGFPWLTRMGYGNVALRAR